MEGYKAMERTGSVDVEHHFVYYCGVIVIVPVNKFVKITDKYPISGLS